MRGWALAALLLAPGCSAPELVCPALGSVSGVSVTVLAPYAAEVTAVRLNACWASQCQQRDVQLAPGSDMVDQGCSGAQPDDTCSATAVPNGTLVGFAEMTELPAGPITVAATVTVNGRPIPMAKVRRNAHATFPAGPRCGSGGIQFSIDIDRTGIR